MSEQIDKSSPYYQPTPKEMLGAARDALDGATADNWMESIGNARRHLDELDKWISGNLLCGNEDGPFRRGGEAQP